MGKIIIIAKSALLSSTYKELLMHISEKLWIKMRIIAGSFDIIIPPVITKCPMRGIPIWTTPPVLTGPLVIIFLFYL